MNPLGLMHRANLERSRGGGEFAEDTRNNLSEAAKSFEKLKSGFLEQQESKPAFSEVPNVVNLEN